MHIHQKGAAVSLSKVVGAFFFLFSMLIAFGVLASIPAMVANNQYDAVTTAALMVFYSFIAAGMFLIGSLYFTMFPNIEVKNGGIEVDLVAFRRSFPWSDIEGVVERKRIPRARAIVLRRRGLFLNRLHGIYWAGLWDKPVILVSPRAENVQEFFQALESRIKSP
jgi:hypothetical protein